MASHQDLWQRYFYDFIAHRLKLVDHISDDYQSDMAHQLLHAYFAQLHNKEMPDRVVQLHCHTSICHHFLAQMATILRPLSEMEEVSIIMHVQSQHA